VSPAKYELGFYIPEDGILRSHRRKILKSYITKSVDDTCRNCEDNASSQAQDGHYALVSCASRRVHMKNNKNDKFFLPLQMAVKRNYISVCTGIFYGKTK
jgi:hypothetical protein